MGGKQKTYRDWALQAQSSDLEARNAAFDHLVRDFQGMVYGIAYSRLQDGQLAEDAAQEAFLSAYKAIAQLKDVSAFPAWLKRIALSKTDCLARRQGAKLESIDERHDLACSEATPEARLEAAEIRQRVRQAVAALPEAQRSVTREYFFMGESQRQISERRNIPLATVKKRLQYAREQLRGLILGFHESLDESFELAMQPEPQREYQPAYIRRRPPPARRDA